jgi:hypothetical protein
MEITQMKKTIKTTKSKKLVVGRETVKALTPGELAAVEGGNVPKNWTSDSVNACCA